MLTEAVVVTNLAAALNELKASWLGGLITLKEKKNLSCVTRFRKKTRLIYPTIPTLQWNTGFDIAQKYQMAKFKRVTLTVNFGKRKKKGDSRALTLVTIRFHPWRGAELLGPNPRYPLWNPPGRGAQGSSKLD